MRIEYTYANLNYETVDKCPICKAIEPEFFSQVSSQPFFVNEVDGIRFLCAALSTYWKCKECGVVYQSPRMKDKDLSTFYSTGIYLKTIGVPPESIIKDETDRGKRNVAFLKNHGVEPKNMIDVGAAHGILLHMAKEVFGCDGRGYDLQGEYALDQHFDEKYDLLSAIHVLEHVTDPLTELLWYRELTTKWLLLEVPKSRGKEETRGLRFPHLFVFPYPTLKKMLEQSGFRVLAMEENPDTRILCEVC